MTFRQAEPAGIIDPSNAIEIWDGDRHVATIYAQSAGVNIICDSGYETDAAGMVIQRPHSVTIALRRA